MFQLLIGTDIPFMKHRRLAYLFSGALVLATAAWLVVKGPRYSVDFTGGTLVQIRTSQVVPARCLRPWCRSRSAPWGRRSARTRSARASRPG